MNIKISLPPITAVIISWTLITGCGRSARIHRNENRFSETIEQIATAAATETETEGPSGTESSTDDAAENPLDLSEAKDAFEDIYEEITPFESNVIIYSASSDVGEITGFALTDREKTRAAGLACTEADNRVRQFGKTTDDGILLQSDEDDDYNLEVTSLSDQELKQNCLDLFGTDPVVSALPVQVTASTDVIQYSIDGNVVPLKVENPEDTEGVNRCVSKDVEQTKNGFTATVNLYHGYWGYDPGDGSDMYNYQVKYNLRPDSRSAFGLVIDSISVAKTEDENSDEWKSKIQNGGAGTDSGTEAATEDPTASADSGSTGNGDAFYPANFDASTADWRNAYLTWIENLYKEYPEYFDHEATRFGLIDVNGDAVPEVRINTYSDAGGGYILTYCEGQVYDWMTHSEFSYIEGKNLFMSWGGREGSYDDQVYSFDSVKKEWVSLFSGGYFSDEGEYLEYDEANDRWDTAHYMIDGTEVSKEAYDAAYNAVYDDSAAIEVKHEYTYDEIVSILTNGYLN